MQKIQDWVEKEWENMGIEKIVGEFHTGGVLDNRQDSAEYYRGS